MSSEYTIRIAAWRDRQGVVRGGKTLRGTLVCRLPKEVVAEPELVRKFYGPHAPKNVFKAQKFDRLVFDIGRGDYLIMPDCPRNEGLWQAVEGDK